MQPNDTIAAPLRAAAYSRVSNFLLKSKGRGLEIQDDDIDAHAVRLGTRIIARWEDDESGAGWDLPGLTAMLDAARRREFDVLIVPEPDRFARNMTKQLVLEEELRRLGVRVEYARYRLDNTPEGRLLKNQLASFAEYEREKIAFRTSRGRHKKAEKGLVVGTGVAPFGYRYTYNADGKVEGLEPNPETAPIVQRIFADATHIPTHEIAMRLDAEGIPAPMAARGRAGGWWSTTIRVILANPVYVGRAVYGRRIGKQQVLRPEAEWLSARVPALVTPEQAEAVRDAIERRRTIRRGRGDKPDECQLRGLLVCGHCDGQIAARPNGRGLRHYLCMRRFPTAATMQHTARCTLPILQAPRVEEAIWQRVAALLLDPRQLSVGLDAARQEHAVDHDRRIGRLDIIDREVIRLRAKLSRIVSERLDAEPDSEAARALGSVAAETETAISRLVAERAILAARPAPGLSDAEALALEDFAAEVRDGVTAATPTERRRIYELLRLRVRIFEDAHGEPLARIKRFRLECDAAIDVPGVRGKHESC